MKFTRKNLLNFTDSGVIEIRAKVKGRSRKFRATTNSHILGENVEQPTSKNMIVLWDTIDSNFKTIEIDSVKEVRIFAGESED